MIRNKGLVEMRATQYYILRYVLAIGIIEYFAYKILDPYYLQFLTTDRGINLSPTHFGLFVSLASLVTMAIDYLTGAFADKVGRRLSWAIAMFLYGSGMLWLSSVSSFEAALLTAVLMGASYAFSSGAPDAWLYDHTAKEGMRKAFGQLYLWSIPLTIAAAFIAVTLGYLGNVRIPIALTGLIVIANGFFILTFPENYGSRGRWLETLKSGARQFAQSRILQLTALQSFFMTLPIWINTAWWVTYLVKEFRIGLAPTALAFVVTAAAGAITGLYISKMRGTQYRNLLIYPTLLMTAAYLLMPFAYTPLLFVPLVTVAITASYFRGSGITLLENEQITEERATALSFLNTLRSAFWFIGPIVWGLLIGAVGLKITFFIAGFLSSISLGMLLLALRIYGRKSP